MNYLQWLTRETPTRFWHDSAIPSEIDDAIVNGARGVQSCADIQNPAGRSGFLAARS